MKNAILVIVMLFVCKQTFSQTSNFSKIEIPEAKNEIEVTVTSKSFKDGKINATTSPLNTNTIPHFKAAVSACNNEDFELNTVSSPVTTPNQISGWNVTSGSSTVNLNCSILNCCPNVPSESEVIYAPNGFVDPNIGSCYPIFSVFGSVLGNSNGPVNNPQLSGGMYGNSFFRIGSDWANGTLESLSKTITVTYQNALLQFAFISVLQGGGSSHGCCESPVLTLNLYNVTTSSVISCPNYSISGCTSANVNFLETGICAVPTVTSPVLFNKWQISTLDLSQYLGQTIKVEFIAGDCFYGGHYGYAYFDAQCGPVNFIANNQAYPVGNFSVNIPNCANVCALAGVGSVYSWSGPNVPSGYSVPSATNSCFTPSNNATYTVFITPQGSCTTMPYKVTTVPSQGISGSVTSTLGTVSGNVKLYKILPTKHLWSLLSTTNIASSSYSFGPVSDGSYAVVAYPGLASMQSNWGNSGIMWKNAQIINLNCPGNATQNIGILTSSTLGLGTGMITGKLTEATGYGQKGLTPGNPIGGITVKGGKNPGGNIVGRTITNSQGQYSLSGLPMNQSGEEYFVLVDLPGLDTSITYHRVFLTNTTKLINLDFTADSMYVRPVDINVGLTETLDKKLSLKLFPNPAKSQILIECNLKQLKLRSLQICDLGGKVVSKADFTNEISGTALIAHNIEELPAGVYLIRFVTDEHVYSEKLIIEK